MGLRSCVRVTIQSIQGESFNDTHLHTEMFNNFVGDLFATKRAQTFAATHCCSACACVCGCDDIAGKIKTAIQINTLWAWEFSHFLA